MTYRAKLYFWLALGALAVFALAAWLLALATAPWAWIAGQFVDPGEAGANMIVVAIPLVLAVLLAVAYVAFGLDRGARASGNPAGEKRLLRLLALVPVVALGLLAADLAARAARDAREGEWIAGEADRDKALAELKQQRFAPNDLAVESMPDGTYRATAQLSGKRRGRYRLTWQVEDGWKHAALVSGTRDLQLDAPQSFAAEFTQAELARAYLDKVLKGRGGVLVEEDFTFRLRLVALLDRADLDRLPRRIAATSADDELAASAETPVPVRFTIPG